MATPKDLARYAEEQAKAAAQIGHLVAPEVRSPGAAQATCRHCTSTIAVLNGVCSGCFGLLNAGYSEAMLKALHAEGDRYLDAIAADGWIDEPRTLYTHLKLRGTGTRQHDYDAVDAREDVG